MLQGSFVKLGKGLPRLFVAVARMSQSAKKSYTFETLKVSRPSEFVFKVELNRPDKRNAMNGAMWREIGECFNTIADDEDCRCVILAGSGQHFCSGIDVFDFKTKFEDIAEEPDIGRRAVKIKKFVGTYQANLSSIELCRKPVIAAVHGHCIGGAMDMISASDIRYCSSDTNFHIKEVDLGLAPDTGTIQRFSKAVGNISQFREYVLSGKPFGADVALQMGIVSRVLPDAAIMMQAVEALAALIASKSPIAVQCSKETLNYSRDHSVAEGLDHVGNWNMAMLQSEDVPRAMLALLQKAKPDFAKL